MKSSNIGGQAVMEGIMMRHKDKYNCDSPASHSGDRGRFV